MNSRLCFALGIIDPDFANAGEFSTSYDRTQYGDERIVGSFDTAGGVLLLASTQAGSGPVLTLTKRDSQGIADTAFGDAGEAHIIDPDTATEGVAEAIQLSTGTILARTIVSGEGYGSIIAIRADGTLDTSFGDGGFLRFGYERLAGQARLIADPKQGFYRLMEQDLTDTLTRYDEFGRVDASFGADGTAVFPRTVNTSVNIDNLGNVTLAGLKYTINNIPYLAIYRLHPDGTPDESFGNKGVSIGSSPVGFGYPELSSDGNSVFMLRILQQTASGTIHRVEKYGSNGDLDPAFGESGFAYVTTPITNQSLSFQQLLIDDQGAVYVNVSWASFTAPNYVAIETFKLQPSGQPEESYGSGGAALFQFPLQGFIQRAAMDEAGSLIWTGIIRTDPQVNYKRAAVAIKVLPDGTLDRLWGTNGVLTDNVTIPSQTIQRLELQPLDGGSMRVVSGWPPFESPQATVGRADTLDRSGNIVQANPFTIPSTNPGSATAPSADGGWFTARASGNTGAYAVTINKFRSDGSVDSSFGVAGTLTIQSDRMDYVLMRAARDGSMVVAAGAYGDQADPQDSLGVALVARLNADGQLDDRFGNDGVLRLFEKPGRIVDAMFDEALGTVLVYSSDDRATTTIQVYGTDGQLKPDFGSNGTLKLHETMIWKAGEIDEQGRILAVTTQGAFIDVKKLQLFQIEPNGTLSTAFGSGGKVTLPIDYNRAFDTVGLSVRHGVIAVAATHQFADAKIRLVALDYAGQLLTELSPQGTRDYDLGPYGESVQDLEFADDGSLWLAAFSRQKLDMTGKVLRLLGSERQTNHNWDDGLDVNADGFVSPLDALHIINRLNNPEQAKSAQSSADAFPDANADTYITAVDALLVINKLNTMAAGGQGEGEIAPTSPQASAVAASHDAVFAGGYLNELDSYGRSERKKLWAGF